MIYKDLSQSNKLLFNHIDELLNSRTDADRDLIIKILHSKYIGV